MHVICMSYACHVLIQNSVVVAKKKCRHCSDNTKHADFVLYFYDVCHLSTKSFFFDFRFCVFDCRFLRLDITKIHLFYHIKLIIKLLI